MTECPAVDGIEFCVQRADLFKEVCIVIVHRQQRRGVVIVGEHTAFGAKAQRDRVVHGTERVLGGLLRDPRDANLGCLPKLTIVQLRPSGKHAQHRRLAAAVAPDQPDAFARVESEGGVVQKLMVTEGEARVVQGDEGHRGKVRKWAAKYNRASGRSLAGDSVVTARSVSRPSFIIPV